VVDLGKFFERTYCVHLDSRPDRWDAFLSHTADWPLAPIQRWKAVPGRMLPVPKWWSCGKGAWGCFSSHRNLIEKCLCEQVRSVLILEDDAVPCQNFTDAVQTFLSAVPANWQMIYLGGQHLKRNNRQPEPVNRHVVVPYNVNRTHAFGLTTSGMEIVYKHLFSGRWRQSEHIDHHLGHLHMTRALNVYCPTTWLIGQNEGKSDISGKEPQTRFWNGGNPSLQTGGNTGNLVAVVGPPRSGTSCVAGVLQRLGVSMGREFQKPDSGNPTGYYEALGLKRFLEGTFRGPELHQARASGSIVRWLRKWVSGRTTDEEVVGAKHLHLCLIVPELVEAAPVVKIITLDRPISSITASLQRMNWWIAQRKSGVMPIKLIEKRDTDLRRLNPPTLRLAFDDVLASPSEAVDSIISFVGITPTSAQRTNAIQFIDPKLNHFSENPHA
jgi:hypothetical protein